MAMNTAPHCCEDFWEERSATPEAPYHYVGSGLPNVFLAGVKYRVCRKCGMQSADIPALKNLLASIATTVVNKASALTGAQVRFLRKRLNRRSLDFAAMISVTPQHLSKIECQDEEKPLDPGRDKLIRVIYRALSGDRKLKDVLSKEVEFEQWIASIHGKGNGERIVATWLANHQWRVEAEAA